MALHPCANPDCDNLTLEGRTWCHECRPKDTADEVVRRLLGEVNGRTLISSGEVTDGLLDILTALDKQPAT